MEAKRRADNKQQEIIERRLDEYPSIKNVIGTNPDRYIVSQDQYGGSIPPHLYEKIAVFSIGGILLVSDEEPVFRNHLQTIEELIAQHPLFQTKKFGKKLINSFFAALSEGEVYRRLILNGLQPVSERRITETGSNPDYVIKFDGQEFILEIKTPYGSLQGEYAFFGEGEHASAGFFDYDRGLFTREGMSNRTEQIIQKAIDKQVVKWLNSPHRSTPVILIINVTIGYPEVNFTVSPAHLILPENLAGILLYRQGKSPYTRYIKISDAIPHRVENMFHFLFSTKEYTL